MVFLISLDNSKTFKTKELWKQILTGCIHWMCVNNVPKYNHYVLSLFAYYYTKLVFLGFLAQQENMSREVNKRCFERKISSHFLLV